MPEMLYEYAKNGQSDDIFGQSEAANREMIMKQCIEEVATAYKQLNKPDPWSPDIKATDDFLDIIFEKYFKKLNLPNIMRKSDYHKLVQWVPVNKLNSEVKDNLDAIVKVAKQAKPKKD
jgi:hypothetical protein